MKVWLLASRFEAGGIERVLVALSQGLAKRGLDVSIVVGRITTGGRVLLQEATRAIEIAPGGAAYFPLGLMYHLRRWQPDVIITFAADIAVLALLLKSLGLIRSAVVCSEHSLSKAGGRISSIGRAKRWLLHHFVRVFYPGADALIAVSKGLAHELSSLVGEKPKCDCIYNPVSMPGAEDASAAPPEDWPWPDDDVPVIIWIGRMEPVKRLDILVRAWQGLRSRMAVRLLLVGGGSQEQELRSRLNHEADFFIAGVQSDPGSWLKKARVLVLSSDCEGFGNVLVEAMLCGVQVVSTACPYGPSEILDGGRYGQLVPPGDARALEEALEYSLDGIFRVDPDVLRARGAEFSAENACASYFEVLQRVIRERGVAR